MSLNKNEELDKIKIEMLNIFQKIEYYFFKYLQKNKLKKFK